MYTRATIAALALPVLVAAPITSLSPPVPVRAPSLVAAEGRTRRPEPPACFVRRPSHIVGCLEMYAQPAGYPPPAAAAPAQYGTAASPPSSGQTHEQICKQPFRKGSKKKATYGRGNLIESDSGIIGGS